MRFRTLQRQWTTRCEVLHLCHHNNMLPWKLMLSFSQLLRRKVKTFKQVDFWYEHRIYFFNPLYSPRSKQKILDLWCCLYLKKQTYYFESSFMFLYISIYKLLITLTCKKSPWINLQHSVSFSPAECAYESQFSQHVKIFRNFMT